MVASGLIDVTRRLPAPKHPAPLRASQRRGDRMSFTFSCTFLVRLSDVRCVFSSVSRQVQLNRVFCVLVSGLYVSDPRRLSFRDAVQESLSLTPYRHP